MHKPEPITLAEYRARRRALFERMQPRSVAVLRAGQRLEFSNDTFHRFRPTSHFRYLTGLCEPEVYAVFRRGPTPEDSEFTLFTRAPEPEREAWHGARVGPEQARTRYGADRVFARSELDEFVVAAVRDASVVYYCVSEDEQVHARVGGWLRRARWGARRGHCAPTRLVHIEELLGDLRCRKSQAELALMRHAIAATEAGILAAMRRVEPGLPGYVLEAEIVRAFIRAGAQPMFGGVVSPGCAGTLSHHRERNIEVVEPENLVMVDVGAVFEGYCADLSATFPATGTFAPRQRALYELTLAVEHWLLDRVAPGANFGDLERGFAERVVEGLVDIGAARGEPEQLLEAGLHRRVMMHNLGHWLGLDIHDETSYGLPLAAEAGPDAPPRWRPFEPGMVLTVEPGIYLRRGTPGIDPSWWQLGARVEDNLSITDDGYELLSRGIPRTVADIEAYMRSHDTGDRP